VVACNQGEHSKDLGLAGAMTNTSEASENGGSTASNMTSSLSGGNAGNVFSSVGQGETTRVLGATSTVVSSCSNATQSITVAANGSGKFSTIQAAVNSIAANNTALIQISLKAGTYNEQVTINKNNVCLLGETAESTLISNAAGTNISTGGTIMVTGNDFSAANVTFKNSAPDGSRQAVALMSKGLRHQLTNCRFVSYQDTSYVNTGAQYFKNCYIQGNTDYIFGDATAVFEGCTMNNVSEGTAVTAPRTPQGTTYGFVFLGGSLTANPTTSTVRSNFHYTARTDNDGNDSTGATGHRYSNLIGGSDTEASKDKLNVTWHHIWWGTNRWTHFRKFSPSLRMVRGQSKYWYFRPNT
jgi:pectin methylesterase-like acyl-CoA thioesterase